jgi:hypothetical protein
MFPINSQHDNNAVTVQYGIHNNQSILHEINYNVKYTAIIHSTHDLTLIGYCVLKKKTVILE